MDAKFAQQLNSAVSFALLAFGVLLSVGPFLKKHKYLRPAYMWWLLQWMAFFFVWILSAFLERQNHFEKPIMLAFADFATIATLAFSLTYLKGRDARFVTGLKALSWVLFLFVCYNFGFYQYMQYAGPDNPTLLITWTAPSQVLSVIGYCAFAGVFLLRYGSVGTSVAFASVIYAILQRPAYFDVFQATSRSAWVAFSLAAGKTLVGITFYSLFFVEAADYERIKIRLTEDNSKYSKFRYHAIGCFILVVVAALVVALLHNVSARIVTETVLTIVFVAFLEVLLLPIITQFLKKLTEDKSDPPPPNLTEMKIGENSKKAEAKSAGEK